VEVPGYSVIGKASESVPVSVADVSGLAAAMREVRRENEIVKNGLSAARTLTTRANAQVTARAQADANRWLHLRDSLRADSLSLIQRFAEATAAKQTVDSARTPAASAALQTALSQVELSRQAVNSRLQAARDAAAALRIDSIALGQGTLRPFLTEAQVVFGERRHALTAIKLIGEQDNFPLVKTYARVQGRLPQLVTRLALSVDSLWTALLAKDLRNTADDSLGIWDVHVRNLAASLNDLAESDQNGKEDQLLRGLVIDAMKDAEITIRQLGAQIGDVLVLSVTDTVGDPGTHRELQLRMPIREFGFVRRISDAVLLMNVPGVRESDELAAAQSTADKSGVGSTREFPLNLRGAPSAGVSLTWTYLPRLDDDYAFVPYPLRSVFNWLRPGVGFNASVISVAHKSITVTPKAPISESAKDPEVGYTFGIVSSAFEGAVQWSVGRTMTGDQARAYSAIGISFLAATDKAKDLFKALAK